jgi:hypothetical protein
MSSMAEAIDGQHTISAARCSIGGRTTESLWSGP